MDPKKIEEQDLSAARSSFWLRLLEELHRPRITLMLIAVAAIFLLPRLWMLGQVRQMEATSPLAPRVIPTFELGLTRDSEPAAPLRELVLPSGTERVALLIEPGDEHRSYLVQLQDAGGKVLWREDGLERGAVGFLLLGIPGEMLQVGNYRLLLEGRSDDGRTEPIGNSHFRVKRPGVR